MGKALIARRELQHEALSALRREPDCSGVRTVSLTTVEIVNDGTIDWHLEVTDPGDVNPEIAYRAADRVKETLASRFELTDP